MLNHRMRDAFVLKIVFPFSSASLSRPPLYSMVVMSMYGSNDDDDQSGR